MASQHGDCLTAETLKKGLPRSLFTKTVHYVPVVGSTNSYAKELAKQGVKALTSASSGKGSFAYFDTDVTGGIVTELRQL